MLTDNVTLVTKLRGMSEVKTKFWGITDKFYFVPMYGVHTTVQILHS